MRIPDYMNMNNGVKKPRFFLYKVYILDKYQI